ncbi:MAG: cation-translocating P-type ATPase [Lachnospiraceae bacterium]|nr:cation-translocating P-type ATPase [Lachnospiraceae bacterium]MCD7765234.1 cation-translocating P-type ATPase [Lachnospiraceae bacterium]
MERFAPDSLNGLTQAQVDDRVYRGLVNTAPESPSKSRKEIIYSNVLTYFNLIFFLIAILLILVGSFRDMTFLPIIAANTFIGIIQELHAKKVLDDLNILNAPKCRVVRDGKEDVIPAEDLVLDDIVVFGAGNQIPADAVIEDGEVLVNESLITGEADQISKKKGDELLSGSFIVSGECRARMDKIGKDSYVSLLSQKAKVMNDAESSEMIRSLNKLVKIVGILIIPIGIILFSQQYFINESGMKDSVTATVAAIIGMIPEGLYLLANVALAASVARLALKKVLVHDMKCIETLARVDVLCVDKTGTITDNTMTVKKMVPLRASDQKEDVFTPEELAETELAVGDFAAAMSVDNITMKAIKEHFRKRTGQRPEQVFSFSSQYKYSGAVFGGTGYVLGAPEIILRTDYQKYEASVEKYSRQGFRVLVFGRCRETLDGGPLKAPADPLCMILLANPIRENAKETFAYFADQGVEIKVISGDNPVTVSEVAKEAGIANAELYVDASVLYEEEELRAAATQYTVFGRVSPEQKRILISALKDAGHTVAMTGDGVNDVLALKDADCSVAMASGSDAAAQVAQLVLLESDFSKMPSVVAEGRRVVNNIERTASLFLVKNIFSLCMSVLSIIFTVNYPLEPSQISLISLFTIGVPAFIMSLERNTDRINGHFLSNVLFKALPGGLTDFIVISGLYLFCVQFGVNETDLSTACTIVLAIVGMMVLYQIASPMTKFHWLLWFAMGAGLIYCMIFMRNIFGITSISKNCMMLLVLFAIVTEPTFRYLSLGMRRLSDFCTNRKAKTRKKQA